MTTTEVRANRRGALEFALVVEGISIGHSTSRLAWSGLSAWTIMGGTLERGGLVISQHVDLRSGELETGSITFRLSDARDSAENLHAVSSLFTGLQAAQASELRATLTATAGTMTVDDNTGFALSGVLYLNQEALHYSAISGTTGFIQLTHALYGSKAIDHRYEAVDANETRYDTGLIPEVTDRPTQWFGRRCWLYEAELLPNGTLATAELRWKGCITEEIHAEGMTWVVQAESIWAAQSTEVLAGQATTTVRGIYVAGDGLVDVELRQIDGGARESTEFTVAAGTYADAEALCAHMTEQLNAAIVALAGPTERYLIFVDDGRISAIATAPVGIEHTYETHLRPVFDVMLALFDGEPSHPFIRGVSENGQDVFYMPHAAPADGGGTYSYAPAPAAIFRAGVFPVTYAGGFSAWRDDQDNYLSESIVTIGDLPYRLLSVNATDNLLTVTELVSNNDNYPGFTVQAVGTPPLEVRLGVRIRGDLPTVWRDAFMDNTNVPLELKGGLDSADWNWNSMQLQFPAGARDNRDRVITNPTPFRDLFLEDCRWSGCVPIMQDGLITVRRYAIGAQVHGDGSAVVLLTNDTHAEGDQPPTSYGAGGIVNRLEFEVTAGHRPGFGGLGRREETFPITANDRASQQRSKRVSSETIVCTALDIADAEIVSAQAYGLATSYFQVMSRPYPEMTLLETGAVSALLPFDAVFLTHWLPPNANAVNSRGYTNQLAIVVGSDVDLAGYTVSLRLRLITDGAKRSGFAPSARISSFVDNGAPAGSLQYEARLASMRYSAIWEGLFFGSGDRLELREWDDDSAPATQSNGCNGHSANGQSVYLSAIWSAALSAVIVAGGVVLVTYDEYDTASQTAAAKLYLHVADDADNLLGASGDLGFKPA